MPVVPFPDPQSSKDSSARRRVRQLVGRRIRRRRQDVVSGASRRAPETDHPRADLALRRHRHRRVFIDDIYAFVMRPLRQMLPAGGDADLHVPHRSVHALHPHRDHRGAVHRGAADLLAGLAVRRAGALRERAALRDSVRAALEHRRLARRGVLALRRVSADVAVLCELLERLSCRSCRASRMRSASTSACCSAWRRLSDAGDGVLPGADGRGHRAVDDPAVQVRGARDFHRRRGHHAELGHGQPDDRGRAR